MVREHPLRNRTQRKVKHLHKAGTQPAIPVGLGMALVHNQQALAKVLEGTTDITRTIALGPLTDEEKRAFIAGVHGIDSRQEMRAYVGRFAES